MSERTSLLGRRLSAASAHYQSMTHPANHDTISSLPSLGNLYFNNTSAPPTIHSIHGSAMDSPRTEHLFSIFNKRHGSYDDDRQGLVQERTGVRVWSESYSSIDFIHDRIKEGVRLRKIRNIPGLRGRWIRAMDASQAWILVILIGAIVAAIAWFIDVVQEWMSDLKQGYCTTHWRYNNKFCCWDKNEYEPCPAWKTWPEVFDVSESTAAYYTAMAMYTFLGLLFSFIAAIMVKYTAETVFMRKPSSNRHPFSKSTSTVSMARYQSVENNNTKHEDTTAETEVQKAYYSAGSGIPEVKVILGGFVIKGFLGIKTLFVKSVGMIFSTSAGLTCGKEGPFVHLACSAANILCRVFPKFNKNESKRREILSAAAAAGVAVAFGAPIGGVLFSLEEVSYFFPIKTMIRSFCSAMVAAAVLKITDPFGTGKIVLFQVHYDKEYHLFEMVPFVLCGVLAGFFGAIVTYYNIKYQRLRRSTFLGKYPVTEVLCIMVFTALVNYWNPFSRLSLSEFVASLFSECSPTNDNNGLCADYTTEIPRLLFLLTTTLIIKMGLTVITFGCPVPGGIFLPGLIVGAVTGRIIGLIVQYITLAYPNTWPFIYCADDMEVHGKCVIPGVYAMVGAAASLAGVTRTTVSLVVIMSELTYSLTYVVPIMISVMTAKWTADAMFPDGIYDLLIDMKQYPYLNARTECVHTMSVMDLTEQLDTIDLDRSHTAGDLRQKLAMITAVGYGEDGGFPLLSSGNVLEGYIATSELSHALHQLEQIVDSLPHQEHGFENLECQLKPRMSMTKRDYPLQPDEEREETPSLNATDFSDYVDYAPLTVNSNASMEFLMDLFAKLGARYVCVSHPNGHFVGIIHKRRFLAYLKELEQS